MKMISEMNKHKAKSKPVYPSRDVCDVFLGMFYVLLALCPSLVEARFCFCLLHIKQCKGCKLACGPRCHLNPEVTSTAFFPESGCEMLNLVFTAWLLWLLAWEGIYILCWINEHALCGTDNLPDILC
jgi:hypothetical protein